MYKGGYESFAIPPPRGDSSSESEEEDEVQQAEFRPLVLGDDGAVRRTKVVVRKNDWAEDEIVRAFLGERDTFWMDDDACDRCYECQKGFTTFNRKHHCRACGQVFCRLCAPKITATLAKPSLPAIDGVRQTASAIQTRLCSYCSKHYTESLVIVSTPHFHNETNADGIEYIAHSLPTADAPVVFDFLEGKIPRMTDFTNTLPVGEGWKRFKRDFYDRNRDHFKRIVAQMIENKRLDPKWIDVAFELARSATKSIKAKSGVVRTIKDTIQLRTLPGGTSSECVFYSALSWGDKQPVHRVMRTDIKECRVLLLDFALEYLRTDRYVSIVELEKQERKYIELIVNKILTLKPNVVFVSQNISSIAIDMFVKADVTAFSWVKISTMERISAYTGAAILHSLTYLEGFQTISSRIVGHSHSLYKKTYDLGGNTFRTVFFLEGPPLLGGTVVLRGEDKKKLKKLKHIVKFALYSFQLCNFEDHFFCESFFLNEESDYHFVTPDFSGDRPIVCQSFTYDFPPRKYPHARVFVRTSPNVPEDQDDYSPREVCIEYLGTTSMQMLENRYLSVQMVQDLLSEVFICDSSDLAWLSMEHEAEEARVISPFLTKHNIKHFQSLLVLHGIAPRAGEITQQCVPFQPLVFDFFSKHEWTLRNFLKNMCFDTEKKCPNRSCVIPLCYHERTYLHGNIRINITVDQWMGVAKHESVLMSMNFPISIFRKDNSDLHQQVYHWRCCKICRKTSRFSILSEVAKNYSFGKLLESLFYLSGSVFDFFCPHKCINHVLFFLKDKHLVSINAKNVNVLQLTSLPTVHAATYPLSLVATEFCRAFYDKVMRCIVSTRVFMKKCVERMKNCIEASILRKNDFVSKMEDAEGFEMSVNEEIAKIEEQFRVIDQLDILGIERILCAVWRLNTLWSKRFASMLPARRDNVPTRTQSTIFSSNNGNRTSIRPSMSSYLAASANSHTPETVRPVKPTQRYPMSPVNDVVSQLKIKDESAFVEDMMTVDGQKYAMPHQHQGYSSEGEIYLDPKNPIIVYPHEVSTVVAFFLSSKTYRDAVSLDTAKRRGRKSTPAVPSPKPALREHSMSFDEDMMDSTRKSPLARVQDLHVTVSPAPLSDSPVTEESERDTLFSMLTSTYGDDHLVFETTGADHLGRVDVTCTAYFARQFYAFRRLCWPDAPSDEHFISSIIRGCPFNASGGKSKMRFEKTWDNRFIMKEVAQVEVSFLNDSCHRYFKYFHDVLKGNLSTILAKIFGYYHVTVRTSATSYKHTFLIMENVFFGHNVSPVYDLKGATRNRFVKDVDSVLLDGNILATAHSKPILLDDISKQRLWAAVKNDTTLLRDLNLMDYSILAGVDQENGQLVVGIIDYIRKYTWDKQVESLVKGAARTVRPTVISPVDYKERFEESIWRYFPCVPDRYTGVPE